MLGNRRCCGAGTGALISYFGSSSGEILFLVILLYCRQFGGCQDKNI